MREFITDSLIQRSLEDAEKILKELTEKAQSEYKKTSDWTARINMTLGYVFAVMIKQHHALTKSVAFEEFRSHALSAIDIALSHVDSALKNHSKREKGN